MTFDFGKGFDERNLRYMRQFYLMYPIWNTVCSKLTWTHYRTLMIVEEQHIRNFYTEEILLYLFENEIIVNFDYSELFFEYDTVLKCMYYEIEKIHNYIQQPTGPKQTIYIEE